MVIIPQIYVIILNHIDMNWWIKENEINRLFSMKKKTIDYFPLLKLQCLIFILLYVRPLNRTPSDVNYYVLFTDILTEFTNAFLFIGDVRRLNWQRSKTNIMLHNGILRQLKLFEYCESYIHRKRNTSKLINRGNVEYFLFHSFHCNQMSSAG